MSYSEKDQVLLRQIGENIRRMRKIKGLSQEALAFRAELDRTYLGSVERGERNIAVINLVRISKALEIEVEALFKTLPY